MATSAFSLKNKLALITGGGTGIGFGIARAFIEADAHVVISGRREDVLAKAIAELGPNANYIRSDVSDHKTIPDTVQYVEDQFGPVDILVNNAGKHLKKFARDTSDEEFLEIINVNLLSVFALTRCCAEKMIKRNKGCILFISSMAALFGIDRVAAYGASKAALTGLMNGLVTEYSKHNVRVNAIAPGWIESELFLNAIRGDDDRKQKIINRIAMDEFGKPEDIGHAAVYLCSEAARYVTGVLLPVDGGAAVNM